MTLYFIGWIIFKLLVTVTLIFGLVKLIIYGKRKRMKEFHKYFNKGVIVLKERFAKGEITEEEYRTRLKVLQS
jgi:uncharacterized membrane protein